MTTIRLLKNGNEAFPAMFGAIDRAVSSLAIEMYIIADDRTGQEFRARLVAAAGRGVQVQVLFDAVGSWNLPDDFWGVLEQAGGAVRRFHPIMQGLFPFRNHRKLLLVDDRIAYIGGMNIADAYFRGTATEPPWRDNMLEISGMDVARLRGSFARMWSQTHSPLQRFMSRLRRGQGTLGMGGGALRFLESGPEDLWRPVRKAYLQVIRSAVDSVDLAMGYFYPHGDLLRALKRAVRRGVRVRLLFPQRADVPIARWAARGLYGRLLRAGIEVWEYVPAMMHAKLVIADRMVIAGSANMDVRSGRINYELVAVVDDPALAARARMDFEDDLNSSVRISIEEWKARPFAQKLKERFSYCLLVRFDVIVARWEAARKMR